MAVFRDGRCRGDDFPAVFAVDHLQDDRHIVDGSVKLIDGGVVALFFYGVVQDGVAAIGVKVVLRVRELVEGNGASVVLLLLQDLARPVAELESKLLVLRRDAAVDGFSCGQLDGRHLRGIGRIAPCAILHRIAVGNFREINDEPDVFRLVPRDFGLVGDVDRMRRLVVIDIEFIVLVCVDELHMLVEFVNQLDVVGGESVVVPEFKGISDPLVARVRRDDGLVDAFLAARCVVVLSLEDVIAMVLMNRPIGGRVPDFSAVGVLDVVAAVGIYPIADDDAALKGAGICESQGLALCFHAVQGGVYVLSRAVCDFDRVRAAEGHAVGQLVENLDVRHGITAVVDEEAIAEGLVLRRVVQADHGAVTVRAFGIVVAAVVDFIIQDVLHDGREASAIAGLPGNDNEVLGRSANGNGGGGLLLDVGRRDEDIE